MLICLINLREYLIFDFKIFGTMETLDKAEEVKEKKERKKKNISEPKADKANKPEQAGVENQPNNSASLKKKRIRLIGGTLFILSSLYLTVALISYFFTWTTDQDKVTDGYWALLFDKNIQVENWLGKFGAIVSHFFMHRGFGISSLLLAPLLLGIGTKLAFKIKILPLGRTIKHTFILTILLSSVLSFTFNHVLSTEWFFLGGNFGYQVNVWLISFFGVIGTALLLVALTSGYIYLGFNWTNILHKDNTNLSNINAVVSTETLAVQAEENTENSLKQKKSGKPDWNKLIDEEEENLSETIIKGAVNTVEVADENTYTKSSLNNETIENNSITQEFEINNSHKVIDKIPAKDENDVELIVEHQKNEEPEFVAPSFSGEPDENGMVHAQGDYDPGADLSSYVFPDIELLEKHGNDSITINNEELQANKERILETLKNYSIEIEKIKATIGPTVTLYEIVPAPGIRISKIKNLEDDIALSLSALGIRIIAPMPGKGTIGIEVPNQKPEVVSMRSIIASEKFQNTSFDLPVALGKTITNETFIADLAKMPHLLMAGATGQGKSVGLNAILVSLLYKKHPSQIKFVLVDPKKVELTLFNTIERHFLAKLPNAEESIITDTKKVIHTLNSLCILMDTRYELLKNAMVRNIKEYNAKFISRKLNPLEGHHYMPYIVLVIDEFADLIMTAGKEVEMPIARLAQLARAIGIHLIIATQRPSVNIITGTIKANFPARIAFRVSAKIDSRTILDAGGAEQLIGRGDMLLSTGNDLIRIQCAFVDTPEVDKITEFIGAQRAYPHPYLLPEYIDEGESSEKENIDLSQRDSFFEEAAKIIVQHQQGSTSLIQRRLKLGYNRAGRIIDQLEAAGIIGPFEGSKARQVLVKDEQSLEQILKSLV